MELLENCTLCPRECKVNRLKEKKGRCHADASIKVARAALHMWEEPCISGEEGSGAVFFSGCSLGCIYCQNRAISGGQTGEIITEERLAEIFLELQEQKANNINLVTAGQYVPQVCKALQLAKNQRLTIPVVYNSSGYEKPETLAMLEGLVDVYLPDFKYMNPETASDYSHAPDYPEVAKAAIAEMVRQCPELVLERRTGSTPFQVRRALSGGNGECSCQVGIIKPYPADCEEACVHEETAKADSEYPPYEMIKKGVIVRHLLLPGHVKEAKSIVKYLHETYGDQIYISIMNQYTPVENVAGDKLLGRKVTKREYARLLDYAAEIGVTRGFYQEGDTAMDRFIPSFDCQGVLPEIE